MYVQCFTSTHGNNSCHVLHALNAVGVKWTIYLQNSLGKKRPWKKLMKVRIMQQSYYDNQTVYVYIHLIKI